MWNILKKPIEKSSLEAWAKIADDIIKVAILALPVILYNEQYSNVLKTFNIIAVLFIIYGLIAISRAIRRNLLQN
ncbi:hypothetical protein A4G20_06705 [Pasteurellaceae bacterium RH1A]|nr:hypothetical protein A4G20_06705 [Pasteurellaceae bacterium RH1A]